jgi:FkbM family methyltransferase
MKIYLIKIVEFLPISIKSTIKNIPVIKAIQASLFKQFLRNEKFNAIISGGPAKGLKFPVTLPQDKLMWLGTWELDFAQKLKSYVQKGFVCYDVGGYKGYYAGIMALSGAKDVFIFEPMPSNADSINQLIDLNPKLPIELHQIAISDTSGEAEFKFMTEDTMGKLAISSFEKEVTSEKTLKVICQSLDDFVSTGHPEPDFIKIDVEGAEEFVLKGGIKLLTRKKPILLIEIHSAEIGLNCYEILAKIYSNITVFETGEIPGGTTPNICHYICKS